MAVEDFVNQPGLEGFATFGECAVRACDRERVASTNPYYSPHDGRWREHRRTCELASPDEEQFRRVQPAITIRGEITLRGLPDRVIAEMLYGLQRNVDQGARLDASYFRTLGRQLLSQQVLTIDDADVTQFTFRGRETASQVRDQCSQVALDTRDRGREGRLGSRRFRLPRDVEIRIDHATVAARRSESRGVQRSSAPPRERR